MIGLFTCTLYSKFGKQSAIVGLDRQDSNLHQSLTTVMKMAQRTIVISVTETSWSHSEVTTFSILLYDAV
jgi:hypothetical protein